MTVLSRISALLDQALPAATFKSAEDQRRGRLSVLFAWILLTQCPVFMTLYTALGIAKLAGFIAFGAVLLGSSHLVVRRSVAVGVHFVLATLSSLLLAIAVFTGGLFAPAIWWLLATPIMAMMTAGRRAALAWLGLVIAVVALFATLELVAAPFPDLLSATQRTVLAAIGTVALGFVLFALAYSYEGTRAEMLLRVDAVNRDMKLVFDNVTQAFVTVDEQGQMGEHRSAIADRWFGPLQPSESVFAWLGRTDAKAAAWLEVSWPVLFEDVLPLELSLDQLPRKVTAGERTLGLDYHPVTEADGKLAKVVVIASDITAKVHAERAEAAQREVFEVFSRIARDPSSVLQFFEEAQSIVASLVRGEPNALRLVHTLKGNAGFFGLSTLAAVCHAVESAAMDEGREPDDEERARVAASWNETAARLEPLIATHRNVVAVPTDALCQLQAAIALRTPYADLFATVETWRKERVRASFERMAEQARGLAERLGKGPIEVAIDDNGVTVEPGRFSPLWAALVHALRNAVDHGIESPDERLAHGKSTPRLRLTSRIESKQVVLEVGDDGRGVDWQRVSEKAQSLGLPHDSHADLQAALFADGMSTKDEVSDVSGRGVGMAALRDVCENLGASIRVSSHPGTGTRIVIRAPENQPHAS
jgi:two-component system chemotaxis sensor kinase CheA